MSMNRKGVIVAAVVAGLFTTAGYADNMSPSATPAAVHCMGVNSCKGMGSCKTVTNSCKGMNSCKGQGVVANLNAKECTDKGGKIVE